MTCKDCIHYDMCSGFTPTDLDSDVFDYCREGRTDEIPDIEERCSSFKDRNRFIELPCKVGDTVYELVNWCDYTDCHFEGCAGCSHCNEKGIVERKFNHSHLGQIGKTVFLSREDAEKALAERSEGK